MKRVLLVDAVEAPADWAAHPLGSVERWFGKHLAELPGVEVKTLPASAPELSAAAESANAVIVSGSPRDAWCGDADVLSLVNLAQKVAVSGTPMLGVCFGHQLLGRALGGEVQRNPAGWEVGSPMVQLTPEGQQSPLFAGFSASFPAIQSHRDAVLTLPPGAKLLATNAHTAIQGFSFQNRVFGVQFHPEMDGEILRHLWTERRKKLRDQIGFDLDSALDSAQADASRLFHNFIAML